MDLDADGHLDIVTGQYHPGYITWFRGTRRGGFVEGVTIDQWGNDASNRSDLSGADERSFSYWNYTSPTFGDLDGDGDLDLVVGGGHGLRVSKNIGTKEIPFFARREPLLTPDGKPLQVRPHSEAEIARVRNAKPSNWSYPELQPAGDFKTQPLLVDWDRDGTLDLIVGDSNAYADSKGISFFRGVGDGTFQPGVPLLQLAEGSGKWLPGNGPRISVTDWNEDGTPDLLVGIGVPYLDGKFSSELAWQYSSVAKVESPGKAPGRWSDETRARVREQAKDPEVAKLFGDPKYWTLNYRGHVYVLLGKDDGSKAKPIGRARAPIRRVGPEVRGGGARVALSKPTASAANHGKAVEHSAVRWHLELPGDVAPGQTVELALVAKMDPTWHIYVVGDAGHQMATTIDAKLPAGLSWVGDWKLPKPNYVGADPGYEGEVRFRRSVKIGADVDLASLAPITATASYMACDPNRCLPPADVEGISITLR